VDHKDFHRIGFKEEAFNYCVLAVPNTKSLVSAPQYLVLHQAVPEGSNQQGKKTTKLLLIRGDCDSKLVIWNIPQVTNSQILQLKQMAFGEEYMESDDSKKAIHASFHPPGGYITANAILGASSVCY
jgi:hypothetical protein